MKTNTAYLALFADIMLAVDPDDLVDADASLPSDEWLALMEARTGLSPNLPILTA